jgi:large subunit ribosomal protein L25
MANEQIKMKAEVRTEQGSCAVGRLRRAGSIPAAVNRIEGGTTLVKFDAHDFKYMLRHHSSEHVLVTLELDGCEVPTLMREVQYDVITGDPIHVDFGEVSLTKKLRVSIPLHVAGEPEGVKVGGGILQQNLRSIDVDCLPMDIVEQFTVDVSALKLGQSLFVRDLALGEKYTVITHKEVPVATVVAAAEDAAAATAEGTEGANPEVIIKGKKEETGATAGSSAAKK